MFVLELIALVLLFAGSAFFSGSEAALTALSAVRMKRLSILQPRLSAYLTEWLNQPHRLLTTILIGNNVVNIAISSLTATMALPLAARVPPQAVEMGVWLAATAALVIFGEVVPKIVGRVYRERITERSLPVLSALSRALYVVWGPVGWIFQKLTPSFTDAPVNKLTEFSLEELQHIIAESQASGRMAAESGEMMKRVLTLHQRTVADILQPVGQVDLVHLEMLDSVDGSEELFLDLLVETGRTRVPVTRGGRPAGYVNVMDLLKGRRPEGVPLLQMVRPLRRVPSSRGVFELLEDFQKSGDHIAVVEDGGRFLGVVTLEDVLEEIVGEILDEYDLENKKE